MTLLLVTGASGAGKSTVRRALSAQEWDIPPSLRSVVVGPETALEIHWTHP